MSARVRNDLNLLFTVMMLGSAVSLQQAMGKERIDSHERLEAALANNHLPSGFVNLEQCEVLKRVGSTPHEKWSFSVSFREHYGIDNKKGEIKTSYSAEILREETIGKLQLRKIFTTFSSQRGDRGAVYDAVITDAGGRLIMRRVFSCPWGGGVHLWRD